VSFSHRIKPSSHPCELPQVWCHLWNSCSTSATIRVISDALFWFNHVCSETEQRRVQLTLYQSHPGFMVPRNLIRGGLRSSVMIPPFSARVISLALKHRVDALDHCILRQIDLVQRRSPFPSSQHQRPSRHSNRVLERCQEAGLSKSSAAALHPGSPLLPPQAAAADSLLCRLVTSR
jgi:hypothetical protein